MKDWKLHFTSRALEWKRNIKIRHLLLLFSQKGYYLVKVNARKATIIHLLQCMAVNYGIICTATEKKGWDEEGVLKIKKVMLGEKKKTNSSTCTHPSVGEKKIRLCLIRWGLSDLFPTSRKTSPLFQSISIRALSELLCSQSCCGWRLGVGTRGGVSVHSRGCFGRRQ